MHNLMELPKLVGVTGNLIFNLVKLNFVSCVVCM